jgi:hypothetical protein
MLQTPSTSLLRLLAGLRPQLHQPKHERITRQRKNNADRCVSPAIVVAVEVDSVQIIAALRVLANLAIAYRVRVDQICPTSRASHPRLQVLAAGLSTWRVKPGELGFGALDIPVEICEDEE